LTTKKEGKDLSKEKFYRISPAYHDYWMKDMEQARSEDASLLLRPEGNAPLKYLFFPGCQLGASDPRYPQAAYELMLQAEPATALLLTCCGSPAYWAGEIKMYWDIGADLRNKWVELGRPILVTACLSCKKLINYVAPEIATTTLYEVLAETEGLSLPKYAREDMLALSDPCTAKDNQGVRDAVCKLLDKMSVPYVLLHKDMHTLPCCGFIGSKEGLNPDVVKKIAAKRVEADPSPYLVYCANCRDLFASVGKDTVHILDLLTGINGKDRKTPHLSLRHENRLKAKALLTHGEALIMKEAKIKLVFTEEIANKMDKNYIFEDDIRKVIDYAESTGSKFIDDEGISIAHLIIGLPTIWVEYRKLGEDEYEVVNCYTHRISLVEPGRELPKL